MDGLEGQKLEDVKITPPSCQIETLVSASKRCWPSGARWWAASSFRCPARCRTKTAFCSPQYWHYDVTHANSLYGEVMLLAADRQKRLAGRPSDDHPYRQLPIARSGPGLVAAGWDAHNLVADRVPLLRPDDRITLSRELLCRKHFRLI